MARERPGRGRVRVGDAACHVAQPVAGRPRAGRRTVAQDAVEPTDLLGLEGIALLDAWAGDHDREFTDARLAEIRRLLDDEKRWLVLGANGTEDVSVVHASS